MIARRQSALGRTIRKMELQKGLGGSEVAAEIIVSVKILGRRTVPTLATKRPTERTMAQFTTLSKALSTLLRHKAVTDGVTITSDGWVTVSDALRWVKKRHRGFTEEDVVQMVAGNDKQRFSLRTRDDGCTEIRANQGHSMPEIAVDMTELTLATAPPLALHGTYQRSWETIRTMGLSKMGRQHVHMARDLPGESGVISGMRASCQVLVYVDVHAAIQAGMRFFESANGVLLTDGFGGVVPPRFITRAVDRRTGKPLANS